MIVQTTSVVWTTNMVYRCLKIADIDRDSSRSSTLSHLSKDLEFTTVFWRHLALHLTVVSITASHGNGPGSIPGPDIVHLWFCVLLKCGNATSFGWDVKPRSSLCCTPSMDYKDPDITEEENCDCRRKQIAYTCRYGRLTWAAEWAAEVPRLKYPKGFIYEWKWTYFFRETASLKTSRWQCRLWPANKMPNSHCACQSRSDFSLTHEVAHVCLHDVVRMFLRFDIRQSVFTWSQIEEMIGPSAKRSDDCCSDD